MLVAVTLKCGLFNCKPFTRTRTQRAFYRNESTGGVVSGRMSSSGPNMQNIPRMTPDELEDKPHLQGVDIREAFVVDPGYVFVTADMDNMEMVATAALSKDETLISLLKEGRDLHAYLARRAFNVGHTLTDKEFKKQYPGERQMAKPVGFAIVYGGTAYTIMKTLGCSEAEAQKLVDAYFDTFPGVKKFLDETYAKLDAVKQLTYPIYGYVKHMDIPDDDFKAQDPYTYGRYYRAAQRSCQNAIIQGTCAFVIKECIVKIAQDLRAAGLTEDQAQVVLQVHDEIAVLTKEEHAPLVAHIMEKHMNLDLLGVALTATAEIKMSLSKSAPSIPFTPYTPVTTPVTEVSHDQPAAISAEVASLFA